MKAVNDLGGVTRLTEAEQKKLNATVTEAIAKYNALGKQAPADMVAIEKATRNAGQETTGFLDRIKGLGTTIAATAAGFFTAQAAFAAVSGVARAISSEFQTLITQGPAVADVAENFAHLTEEAGRSGAALIGTLREGTHATITDFELMKLASQDLTAGMALTDQQFATLAKGAFALAQATGTDVKQGLDTMNDAMLTGRTRTLALLTGKIDLEQAELRYAHSIGVTRKELTEEQKLEAARAAILDSVTAATERLGVQTDGLDERIQQVRTAWGNFQNELGRMIAESPVINTAIQSIADTLGEAFSDEQGELVRKVAAAIDDVAIGMVHLAKLAIIAGESIVKEWKDIQIILKETETVLSLGQLVWLKYQQAAMLAQADFTNWAKLQTQIKEVNAAIAAQQAEIARLAAERRASSGSAQAMLDDLDRLIAAMEAAQAAGRNLAPALGDGPTGIGGGARAGAGGVHELSDAARKLQQELADATATRAYNNELGILRRNADATALQLDGLLKSFQRLPPAMNALLEPPLEGALHDIEAAILDVNDAVNVLVDNELATWAQDSVTAIEQQIEALEDAEEETEDFGKSTKRVLDDLNNVFQRAFEGGGGVVGAIKSLATSALEEFGKLIPIAGKFISQFAGAIVAGAAKIGSLIFGGPSAAELEGRKAAESFRKGLEQGLSEAQRFEAASTGNAAWASSVIAIRDAYLAVGRTEAEALAIADRLWRAERDGAESVQKVIDEINQAFEEQRRVSAFLEDTLPAALETVASSGALVTAEFADMLAQLEEMGAATEAINAFVIGQGERAVSGIQALVENSVITSTETAQGLTGALAAIFDEMTRRGLSAAAAIDLMGPTIDALQDKLRQAGVDGGTAWDLIRNMTVLARDEIAGPALEAIHGASEALAGLHNMGILNQETFVALTNQATAAFQSIVDGGRSGSDALQLMAPDLQTIWELMTDFGYIVDESTQQLIDQAQEAGLVGEAHRSAQEKAQQAMERTADAMERVADILARVFGESGDHAEEFSERTQAAIDAVPTDIQVTFRGVYVPPEGMGGGVDYEQTAGSYQGGTHGQYVDFGRRSLVAVHGRERISTEAEGRADAAALAAIANEVAGLRRDMRKMDLWIRDGLIKARRAA